MTDDPNNVSAVPAADAGWGEYGKDAPIARLAWALARIADMKDRDGNAIEMHRDELRAIAKTALATQTSIQPPPAAVGPREDELRGSNKYDPWDDAQFARHVESTAAPSLELQDDLSQRLRDVANVRTGMFADTLEQAADKIDVLQAVVDELVAAWDADTSGRVHDRMRVTSASQAARRLAKAPQNG